MKIILKHIALILFLSLVFIDFVIIVGDLVEITFMNILIYKVGGIIGAYILYHICRLSIKNNIFPNYIINDFDEELI